jgi:hypothetical protein
LAALFRSEKLRTYMVATWDLASKNRGLLTNLTG